MGFDKTNIDVSDIKKTMFSETKKTSKKLRIEDIKPKVLTSKELNDLKIHSYSISL